MKAEGHHAFDMGIATQAFNGHAADIYAIRRRLSGLCVGPCRLCSENLQSQAVVSSSKRPRRASQLAITPQSNAHAAPTIQPARTSVGQ